MTAPADGTGPSAGHNITAGTGTGGGKNPFRTLLVLGGASALLAGTAQALGSPALALAAFLPSLALNHRAMKPATREQLLATLVLWLAWSVFGAVVVVSLSLGRLHWGWGAPLPCLVISSMLWRQKPEVPGTLLQWLAIPLLWDPPFLAALAICDRLGLTLLHDGHGRYLSEIDDNICIAALPSACRIPDLRAAKVGSVVNMCWESKGPTAAYQEHGIIQLRLPTIDSTAPSLADLQTGVHFIREQLARRPGQRVLIHCKGGRGRAATMAAAWYVSTGLSVKDAVALLTSKRSVTEKVVAKYAVLQEFAAQHHPSPGPITN